MAATLVGAKRWAYLTRSMTIRIASGEADGSIYLSPVWFVVRDRRIFIPIDAAGRHGVNALAGRPISGLVDEGNEYSTVSGVRILGRMEVVESEDDYAVLQQMMFDKYFYVGHPHAYSYFEMGEMAGRKFFEFVPDRMIGWDARESTAPLTFESRQFPSHITDRRVTETDS